MKQERTDPERIGTRRPSFWSRWSTGSSRSVSGSGGGPAGGPIRPQDHGTARGPCSQPLRYSTSGPKCSTAAWQSTHLPKATQVRGTSSVRRMLDPGWSSTAGTVSISASRGSIRSRVTAYSGGKRSNSKDQVQLSHSVLVAG